MIEFENVSKSYASGRKAVDGVSFKVESHTITALVGSSGSGKSTLLSMVNRMIDPTSGRVLVDDIDVATVDPVHLRRSIGYVLQAGGLLPHRSVLDNIATVPVLKGESKSVARARALELLEVVGLDASLAQRYPAQLSGGQQQRVGVARALAADPNILLMDEPFGAVDPIVRIQLQQELIRLQKELGKTVLLVTHDIDEAFTLADEVVVLSPMGQIAQKGTPQKLLSAPANDFVSEFIGLGSGSRTLEVHQENGVDVVVDASGRPLGVIK
ncbi:ATP-binding cassette domain-containing protein [Corynebacterium callunae]|uniref:ABC transporter ATP-binding protein n=1 Tax=Corynebacterium callunae TaxID=1721 RepID=UPI003981FB6B